MCKRRLNLAFDLVARKQGYRILIALELFEVVRHDLLDELAGFLIGLFVVDQDLADVSRQVVAQGAYDRVAFAVNQEWRFALQDDVQNCRPDRQQVFEVPGEFFCAPVNAGRAQDHAHAVRYNDIVERLTGEVTVGADDAS